MRRGIGEEALAKEWFPAESSNSRKRGGRTKFEAGESSADAMRFAVLMGAGSAQDRLRKFAGSTTGSSPKPQLLCEPKLLLSPSPDIAPLDSWHGDFRAVLVAS